jgi:hypothetical protein
MNIVFYIVAALGIAYFTCVRRKFDLLAFAFVSACFYFLPGFVGYAAYFVGIIWQPAPLVPQIYTVMTLVLSAILATALIADRLDADTAVVLPRPSASFRFTSQILTLLSVVGCVMTLITVGDVLFESNKFLLMSKLNYWYVLWTTTVTLGFVISFLKRQWWLVAINFAFLLFDLFIGFRVELVVAMLTVALIRMSELGSLRLYIHWKPALIVFLLALGMFTYKYFLTAIKLNDWDLVASQIHNPDALLLIFANSEPFVVQGTLNEILRHGYEAGMDHLMGCFYLLVPFAPQFGAEVIQFDSIYQPDLFPTVTDFGLGNNIWGEMIASGGWALFSIFLVLYCFLLFWGRVAFRRCTVETQATVYVVFVYWAFYVHRNDLLYQLTLSRRILLTGFGVMALSAILVLAAASAGRRVSSPAAQT